MSAAARVDAALGAECRVGVVVVDEVATVGEPRGAADHTGAEGGGAGGGAVDGAVARGGRTERRTEFHVHVNTIRFRPW